MWGFEMYRDHNPQIAAACRCCSIRQQINLVPDQLEEVGATSALCLFGHKIDAIEYIDAASIPG